jgi:hypothetical protein
MPNKVLLIRLTEVKVFMDGYVLAQVPYSLNYYFTLVCEKIHITIVFTILYEPPVDRRTNSSK